MGEHTPRNQEGEPPTRTPDQTVRRLEEKARGQTGDANRERTEDQVREVRSER